MNLGVSPTSSLLYFLVTHSAHHVPDLLPINVLPVLKRPLCIPKTELNPACNPAHKLVSSVIFQPILANHVAQLAQCVTDQMISTVSIVLLVSSSITAVVKPHALQELSLTRPHKHVRLHALLACSQTVKLGVVTPVTHRCAKPAVHPQQSVLLVMLLS